MEINEIFDPDVADLLGINPEYLYVSRVIQKAEIEVNEEGTVASAAAGNVATDKSFKKHILINHFRWFLWIQVPTTDIQGK